MEDERKHFDLDILMGGEPQGRHIMFEISSIFLLHERKCAISI